MKNRAILLAGSVLLIGLIGIGSLVAFAENGPTPLETAPVVTIPAEKSSPETPEKEVNQATAPLGYDIDPRIQKNLEKNGVKFYPETSLNIDKVAISEKDARDVADKSLVDGLTQEPLDVIVQYGSFTYPALKIGDRKVWKITYIGTSMELNGPRLPEGQSIKQPTSRKAITWVIVDATTGEIINRYSSGPKSD